MLDDRNGAEASRRHLAARRVLLVGLEPWGMVAAAELASAGLGALHVLDDGIVGDDDLHGARLLDPSDRGLTRPVALSRALGRSGVTACAITSAPLIVRGGGRQNLDPAELDLVLASVVGDELLVLAAVARWAHEAGIPSLSAHLEGFEAVLGPAVLPGATACWNCCRQRRLANAAHYDEQRALHDALLRERPRPRRRASLAPAAGLLGHDLAMAALGLLAHPEDAPLAGRLLVRNLVSLRTSIHGVLRLPACDVCGGALRAADEPEFPAGARLEDARDPCELRRMLEGVVDGKTGIVSRVVLEALGPAAYPEAPCTAMATLSRPIGVHVCPHAAHPPPSGAGKGKTRVSAMIRAVGEAVERYAASCLDGRALRKSTLVDLRASGADHLSPRDLCFYDESQYARADFPYARVSEAAPLDWVLGRWLDTRAPVYVPALPVFFDYPAPCEEAFCQVTSNGLAAGASLNDAALRAAMELIERDAFMMTWLSRLPGRRLHLDESVDPSTREVARQLAERGARLELYLLEAGVAVPTVMAVGFGDGQRWPGATVALAAHLSPRVAIDKAVAEQGHVGPYLCRMMIDAQRPVPERPEDVCSLDEHALYYFPPSRASAFAFLDKGPGVRAAELEEPASLTTSLVVERLRAAGLRVAIVDVTSADLAKTPFRVVRAVGPGFVQIHFGHRLAPLGHPRVLASLAARPINPDPHPMA
jgi:ribosomal protein S12 methylthiotransferase accessory factor